MRFLSVCSGIEAASCAWNPLDWKAVAFSEIEKFPSAVLKHRYPDTPNYGDMTQFKDWPDAAIDLLCGGTPCQSFSVAGLRKGLDDPRGNLMLTFGGIAAQYRPRWLVWENVPGVLSSDWGRDFAAFLILVGKLGYGFAYRVHDAQYFGVAQRRKRVYVVGCLGDWRSAAAVLFERHGLQGHPAPRREAGQEVAGTLKACASSGGWSNSADHAAAGLMIPVEQEISGTITANFSRSRGCGTPEAMTIAIAGNTIGRKPQNGGNGMGFDETNVSYTLTKTDRHAVAFGVKNLRVRRLTPLEYERLQGFPDFYTRIPYRKKVEEDCPDSPRYKAIGNSWAVPHARWIGRRIDAVEAIHQARRMSA